MSEMLSMLEPAGGPEEPDLPEPSWLPPQIEHLSASSINMLQRCPEQFRHRYLLKQKEAPGVARILGSVEWGVQVEGNFRQKVESGVDVPTGELLDFYHHEWERQVDEAGGVSAIKWGDDEDEKALKPDKWRELGAKMTETYHQDVSPHLQPLELEQKFEAPVAGVPVPLLGFRDLIARPAVEEQADPFIVEHKTSKKKESTLKPDWRMQGRIYQLFEPLPVAFHVVTKTVTPKVWTPAGTAVTEALEGLALPLLPAEARFETERIIVNAAKTIAAFYNLFGPDESWPTTGTGHTWACGWCAWRRECPAWKGVP